MFTNAYGAMQAGASGISFGRNVFNRQQSDIYISALRKIVHEQATVEEALAETRNSE
jgi:class I fructose-bisphosphate aldolase